MVEKININKVKSNTSNPRFIKDVKFAKLVSSIKSFPEMLEKRPIVVDEDLVVLGGNMRLKACKEAGLKEVFIDIAEGWTEKQKQEFIIKDNVGFGEWNWDMLANEWDTEELESWGMDIWVPEVEEEPKELKDLSEELKDTYEVIIECKNDGEQEEVYNKLIKEGYICRVLTL